MINKPEIIVLVGNIGSGKSTICKKYVEKGYYVVARDALRYMIGGGNYIYNPEIEPAIFKSETNIIISLMFFKVNIIIDEVGISKKLREKYIKLAKEHNYKVIALVMPKLTMKESVDRRMNNPHQQNDRKLWEQIWTQFNSRYTEPTKEEGFDEIIKL